MFDQVFLSPQMKRSVVISKKKGIYELPHKLLSDLRLILGSKEIRKYQVNLKISYNYSLVLSSPLKMKTLSVLAKNY